MRPLSAIKCSLVALWVVAGLPGAALADLGLRDDPDAQDVAIAGREVLVAGTGAGGSITVAAVALDGGGARSVLTVPSPGRGWRADLGLAASSEQAGLVVELRDRRGVVRAWRVYSGSPSGPLVLVREARGERAGTWVPVVIDADGPRLLLTEFEWKTGRPRSVILEPGRAPVAVTQPDPGSAAVAIAGDRVAFLSTTRRGGSPPPDRVRISNWRTGAFAPPLTIPDPGFLEDSRSLDLTSAGRVVLAPDRRLSVGVPGAPLQRLGGEAFRSAPAFAGEGRIAALEHDRRGDRRAVLLDETDGSAQPLGPRSSVLERLAADGVGVAWLANGCVRYAAISGVSPTGPASDPCPTAELALSEADSRLRGRSARINARCVRAPGDVCHGTAIVRRSPVAGRGPVLARGRFAIAVGGWRRVDVRFDRRGVRFVRRTLRRGDHPDLTIGARVQDGRVGAGYLGSGLSLKLASRDRA